MHCSCPSHEILSDGTEVTYRPIRRGDRHLLERGFEQLSEESRYRRFLGPRSQLTPTELTYLTDIDGRDHVAIGALLERGDEEEGLGVARFIRKDADTAEIAIVVIDAYQNRGIGRHLLQRLVGVALDNGVHRFRCDVLSSNIAMHRLLAEFSAVVVASTGGTTTFEIDLEMSSSSRIGAAHDAGLLEH